MATYLIMSDHAGIDSIRRLVDAGKVKHFAVNAYQDFFTATASILKVLKKGDTVIVDTLNSTMNVVRKPIALAGKQYGTSLEDQVKALGEGEKYALPSYSRAKDLIIREIQNLSNAGGSIITILHETDPQLVNLGDGYSGRKASKRLPAINQDFWTDLKGLTSDIFRLYQVTEDTEMGGKEFPAYTRFLQLKETEESVAKYHVDDPELAAKLPKLLSNPTLPKLHKLLGKQPTWMLLYGPPGAGKTTLAVSGIE